MRSRTRVFKRLGSDVNALKMAIVSSRSLTKESLAWRVDSVTVLLNLCRTSHVETKEKRMARRERRRGGRRRGGGGRGDTDKEIYR